MSRNESPITSVPEPAASSSSSSGDPLANIITQVSPTSAGAPSRGGPARPTRVTKQQGEKKKKKDKKDGLPSAAPAAPVASAAAKADEAAEQDEQLHSHKASSTLVGTSTTKGSNIIPQSESDKVGLTQDKPVDAAATPTEPDPVAPAAGVVTSDGQVMTSAAEKMQSSEPGQSTSAKNGKAQKSGDARDTATSKASAPQPGTSAAKASGGGRSTVHGQEKTSTLKKTKKGKKSLMSKIVAVLTCSGATGAAIAAEDGEEMSEKRNGRLSGNAKKVSSTPVSRSTPKSAAKGLHTPSNRGSVDKTTIGGGTRLPRDETGDVMSGAVVPPGSSFVVQDGDAKKGGAGGSGSSSLHKGEEDDDDDENDDEEDEEWMGDDQMDDDEDQTEEQRLILQGGAGIPRDELGNLQPLLGPIGEVDQGRKCLVLDLDETLVHSSFKMISNADFTVPVEIEGTVHNVYVIKRPGVDEFMRKMGELYEVVVFTASLSKYADPVLDILDIHQVVRHRLFRESCYNHRGNYVKDLSQLGREIETSIIIDNSPASYIFHPNNAVPISSWFNDPHDTELTDLCPFLAELADVGDVRAVLDGGL